MFHSLFSTLTNISNLQSNKQTNKLNVLYKFLAWANCSAFHPIRRIDRMICAAALTENITKT